MLKIGFERVCVRAGVVSESLGEEFVVLDRNRNEVHALSGDHARVWAALIADRPPALDAERASEVVESLEALGLVECHSAVSRRTVLGAGVGLIAVAGVSSLALPALAQAASVGPGSGQTALSNGDTFTIPGGVTVYVTLVGGGGGAGGDGFNDGSGGAGAVGSVWNGRVFNSGSSPVTLVATVGGGGGGGYGGDGYNLGAPGGGGSGLDAGGSGGGTNPGFGSGGAGGGGGSSALSVSGLSAVLAVAGGGGGGGATNSGSAGAGNGPGSGGAGQQAGVSGPATPDTEDPGPTVYDVDSNGGGGGGGAAESSPVSVPDGVGGTVTYGGTSAGIAPTTTASFNGLLITASAAGAAGGAGSYSAGAAGQRNGGDDGFGGGDGGAGAVVISTTPGG